MDEKKKILFIVEAMGGGVFTYIVELTNNLVNHYDMYIAYGLRRQTPEDFRDYFDDRVKLIEVKNFGRSINIVMDTRALFEIKRIAAQIQPDLIHLHSSKAGVLGRWAFNGNKIPLFYTPHGYSFLMRDHSFIKRMIYKILEILSSERNCTTISCSVGEHFETLKLTKNATYVSNGINIKDLQEMTDSIEVKEHDFSVFTLGRICYQKNPKLFNKIALGLPEIRFIWIGDGELRNELSAPNIEITGWTKREQALRYSMNSDVFLLTSLWEGLPISLLEAMFMKKICVVSDVIGNHDVIHHEINGYVCNSLEEFIQTIRTIRYEDTSEMIERAYDDAITQYNTNVMADRYSDIYQNKLKQVRSKPRGGGVKSRTILYILYLKSAVAVNCFNGVIAA